jgi:hypothetical protein
MSIRYTNEEIRALVKEPKRVERGTFSSINWLNRDGHKRADIDVEGDDGHFFTVKLRQNHINPLDFSVILGVEVPQTNVLFRLRRYNGKHWHRNKIEDERFRDFHIHTATERYQERGFDEDQFAQATDRYSSFGTALRCMIEDCGFRGGETSPPSLFDASP